MEGTIKDEAQLDWFDRTGRMLSAIYDVVRHMAVYPGPALIHCRYLSSSQPLRLFGELGLLSSLTHSLARSSLLFAHRLSDGWDRTSIVCSMVRSWPSIVAERVKKTSWTHASYF